MTEAKGRPYKNKQVRIGIPVALDNATAELCVRVAEALADKLMKAKAKYGYTNGWTNNHWQDDCQRDLLKHLEKGDPIDVIAFAAFCFHHGWPTKGPENPDNASLLKALEEAKAALKTAVGHIDHMAAFISTMNEKHNAGYSFESLGEDMWSIRQPLEQEK